MSAASVARRLSRSFPRLPSLLGLILIMFTAAGQPVAGQGFPAADEGSWVLLNPLRRIDTFVNLIDVSCPADHACFAVGAKGAILATVDGGDWWQRQQSGSSTSFEAISCPTSIVCFATAGTDVFTTTDGGASLLLQHTGAMETLQAIDCITASDCTAVGSKGTIVSTSDGGASWLAQISGTSRDLNGVDCPTSSICYAVGGFGTIIATTNGGITWRVLRTEIDRGGRIPLLPTDYFSISCPSALRCIIAGRADYIDGTVGVTNDGGLNWTMQRVGDEPLMDIGCLSSDTCYAVGEYKSIIVTNDGGVTWEMQSSGTYFLRGISCVAASTCVAVGNDSAIVRMIDAGGSWQPWASGSLGTFTDINCPTPTDCRAVGAHGVIAVTSDGGASWQVALHLQWIKVNWQALDCPTTVTCFAVGGNTIIRTSDGGATWSEVHTIQGTWLAAISCPESDVCFAAGKNMLMMTTDGGVSWNTAMLDPLVYLHAIDCPTVRTCTAVGFRSTDLSFQGIYHPVILMTADRGQSWRMHELDLVSISLMNIDCPTASTCFAVGDEMSGGSLIVATDDGGKTWSDLTGTQSVALGDISCATITVCVAAGRTSIISTSDAGRTWRTEAPSRENLTWFNGVDCPLEGICFVSAQHGLILATNHPPSLDLNGAFPGTDFSTTFTEGGPPIPLLDPYGIADPDPWQLLRSATVTIANPLDAPAEKLVVDPVTLAETTIAADFDPTTGVLMLSGVDTVVNYRRVLGRLRYANTVAAPNTIDRVIAVQVNDGALDSNIATSTVAIRLAHPPDIALASFTATADASAGVSLAWETTAEPSVAGFKLRRARTLSGPYEQVNAALIPAQGSSGTGGRYSLGDSPGIGTFHYWLEAVDGAGAGQVIGRADVGVGTGRLYMPIAVSSRP
jgi:photosystem II stability/assembly factor-like uncharacterized protein